MVKPALLIVAHGERGGNGDDRLAHDLAERLARSPDYRTVRPCFISKEPSLSTVFDELQPGPVDICPLFMSDGYFVKQAIPKMLSANGTGKDRQDRPVEVSTPVGLYRRLPQLVSGLAASAAQQAGLAAQTCRLLLVAHGSRNDDASRIATLSLAAKLDRTHRFAGIDVAFLDESPFLDEQLAGIAGPAIVVGLFAGLGMHGAIDLPGAIKRADRTDIVMSEPLAQSADLMDMICDGLCGGNSFSTRAA